MTTEVDLVKGGVPDVLAKEIAAGAGSAGITAAGTTQATATAVHGGVVTVTTCAAGAGVALDVVGAFSKLVFNNTANALLVYPPVGSTINALAANAGYSVAAGKTAHLVSPDGVSIVALQG